MIIKLLDIAFFLSFIVYSIFIIIYRDMLYLAVYLGYWFYILIPFLFFKFIMLIRGREYIVNKYSILSAAGFFLSFLIQVVIINIRVH